MPLQFAITLFLSASLLFMVQPMVGKMVLPLLGGSPAVWNACMVFFQALLLLGYLYSHWLSTRFTPKKQLLIHMGVLAIPLGVMAGSAIIGDRHTPIAIAESLAPRGDSSPILSVMALLSVAIGIPFFVSSTSAPLLQKWFAYTGHPSARDPYFLYAASNAGSLIFLLGYPLFLEPYLRIFGQTWLWAGGFVVLVVAIYICGRAATNPIGVPPASAKLPTGGKAPPGDKLVAQQTVHTATEPKPTWQRKLKWVALAFVPSSLMLGVTTHMTTDIASIPLLWVIPLALYLVTFIVAFGKRTIFKFIIGLTIDVFTKIGLVKETIWTDEDYETLFRMLLGNLAPVMILLLVFLMISGVNPGTGLTLMLHLATFYAAALMCHYELARDRPGVQYLTQFFLLMSVGGVLGGLFNSIIAPLVFSLAYEYPIALIVACLLVPKLTASRDPNLPMTDLERYKTKLARIYDVAFPVLMGLGFWLLTGMLTEQSWFGRTLHWLSENIAIKGRIEVGADTWRVILLFAVPVMVCFFFVDRPTRFALAVAAILGLHTFKDEGRGIIHSERSFFGILKIEEYGVFHRLVHGTTLHGTQISENYITKYDTPVPFGVFSPWDVLAIEGTMAAWDPRQEPLTYYHRSGPVGAMVQELRTRKGGSERTAHFAMVGLGTGSVSCYALPGQKLTFYEIDPAVKHLVADTDKYFSYVTDARNRGAELDFRMGDARLKLKDDVDRKYHLLLVDAFSSDSIPVHLLTTQAVQLYLDRMTDDGLLALHISNKFVRLEPVVAKIAQELGIEARVWNDDGERRPGKTASSWVVLARKREHFGNLYSPYGDLAMDVEYATRYQLVSMVKYAFGAEITKVIEDAGKIEPGKPTAADPKVLAVEWLRKRAIEKQDANAAHYAYLIDKHGLFATLDEAMHLECGHVFRPVKVLADVPAWTDDYSDVLRVMMIKELQWVRKQFGMPTPVMD